MFGFTATLLISPTGKEMLWDLADVPSLVASKISVNSTCLDIIGQAPWQRALPPSPPPYILSRALRSSPWPRPRETGQKERNTLGFA